MTDPTRKRGRHAAPSLVDTGDYATVTPAAQNAPADDTEEYDVETDYDDGADDGADDEDDLVPGLEEPEPEPVKPALVENKVIAGTAGSFVISTALAQFNNMSDAQILDGFGLNPTIQYIVILFLPPLITFLGGYFTRSNRG